MSEIQKVEDWLDDVEDGTVKVVIDDTFDLSALALAADRVATANTDLHRLAEAARANGRSWAEIGHAVGTTRQAAQQRFGHQISA
jgi:hypothetical protein